MKTNITITPLCPGEMPDLIDCIQGTFPAPNGEPMAKLLNITAEDYLSYTQLVAAKAVADELTLVAKTNGNLIAGFLVSEDLSTAPDYSRMAVSEKFAPLLAILDKLDHAYLTLHRPKQGEALHLYMLGVRGDFAGLGIGTLLLDAALKMGYERGYKRAVAETTGEYSRAICRKLGSREFMEIPYRTFAWQGSLPFRSMTLAQACVLQEFTLAKIR